MADTRLRRYINRELSWLEFNARVLYQATRSDVPLLERLKYLCIVTTNFDEFFMVRVAAVKRQIETGDYVQCPSGIAPSALLTRILGRTRELAQQKYRCLLEDLLPGLARAGLVLRRPGDYTPTQSSFLQKLFKDEVFPVLTPIRVSVGQPMPYVTNLRLYSAFMVRPQPGADLISSVSDLTSPDGFPGAERRSPLSAEVPLASAERSPASAQDEERQEFLSIVQIPTSLDRIIYLPDEAGTVSFALLEDVVVQHAAALFPGYTVTDHCMFRVTRDADMGVDEERDEDFVEAMEQVIAGREFSHAVRLSVSRGAGRLRKILAQVIGIDQGEVFDKSEPLDVGSLIALTSIPGFEELKFPRWQHFDSPNLPPDQPVWDVLRRRDVALYHPFESFEPVIRLLQDAASDPAVLAIKMTLYRTSGDSPVVRALERAAEAGKQVTVLVEIKARFDEERNITWAERLERSGVIVIHGVARLKVHAKVLLIIRREPDGIRRYVHLGTGNYNENTARLYTDLGLMTTRTEVAYEAGVFFNAITGYSAIPALNKLSMAPVGLKGRILQLIQRETLRSRAGIAARILGKLNSLADPEVIEALYEASQAGVEIKLNVRGICMLVPGVRGLSDRISVVSIIDRYLEHSRMLYFHNGGTPEVYGSSADWMPRNLERRVELMFPIEDEEARARATAILEVAFRDTTNAHLMQPNGAYRPVAGMWRGPAVRSQELLHESARERAPDAGVTNQKVFEARRKLPKV